MITRDQFETAKAGATNKWQIGIDEPNKFDWFTQRGKIHCSLCDLFYIETCGIYPDKESPICPLYDKKSPICASEFYNIYKVWKRYFFSNNILTERKVKRFNKIFNENAPKLLDRIKALKYEDLNQ